LGTAGYIKLAPTSRMPGPGNRPTGKFPMASGDYGSVQVLG